MDKKEPLNEENGNVSSHVSDLRSMMNILEAQFQKLDHPVEETEISEGEDEDEDDDAYGIDLPKTGDHVEIDGKKAIVGKQTDTDIYGGPAEFEVKYENGEVKNHSVDSIIEGDSSYDSLDEDCGYDYREHDPRPKPYPGKGSRDVVQPDTRRVPARSSDNPLIQPKEIEESAEPQSKTFKDYVAEMFEDNSQIMAQDNDIETMKSDITRFAEKIGMGMDGARYLMKSLEMANEMSIRSAHRYVAGQYWPAATGDDIAMVNDILRRDITSESLVLEFQKFSPERLNELSPELKRRYIAKASAEKEKHEKRAGELDDLGYDADRAEKMGIMKPGAGDRVRKWVKDHDRIAYRREKGLDRATGYVSEPQMEDEAVLEKMDWKQKIRQYGTPFYINTDMGYASLDSIMSGNEEYFEDILDGIEKHSTRIGFTILEIDRNGRKGFNYINSPENSLQPGTPVTVITQTTTGNKFRPGKFIMSVTAAELADDYDKVVANLSKLGISPSKKLPVKSFD